MNPRKYAIILDDSFESTHDVIVFEDKNIWDWLCEPTEFLDRSVVEVNSPVSGDLLQITVGSPDNDKALLIFGEISDLSEDGKIPDGMACYYALTAKKLGRILQDIEEEDIYEGLIY